MTSEITEQSNTAFIIQYQIARCIRSRRLVYRRYCRILAGSADGYSELRSCVFAGTVDATLATNGASGGLVGMDESAGAMQSDPDACGVIENCISPGFIGLTGQRKPKAMQRKAVCSVKFRM